MFSTFSCFVVPVFASSGGVGSTYSLYEGFQSLLFILGLSINTSDNISHDTLADHIDDNFLEAISGLDQSEIDSISSAYENFKDNLVHGYMLITPDLWDFFKDTCYNDISISVKYKTLNSYQKDFINRNASIFPSTYFIFASPCRGMASYGADYNCWQMWVLNYSDSTKFSFINPPSYTFDDYVSQTLKRYKFADVSYSSSSIIYSETYSNRNNTLISSGYLNASDISCVYKTNENLSTFNYMFLSDMSNIEILDNLTDVSSNVYDNTLDNSFIVGDNGLITTNEGVLPQVLDDSTQTQLIDDITAGDATWISIISSIDDSYPENPAIPDQALTLPELDNLIADLHLERLESKFPFCIPNDIKLIFEGATAVSGNAPVITIPIDISFNGHTYYQNNEFIKIDFSMFDDIIPIFREGFFLLFLVGLLWVSIEILQAFFVVTE